MIAFLRGKNAFFAGRTPGLAGRQGRGPDRGGTAGTDGLSDPGPFEQGKRPGHHGQGFGDRGLKLLEEQPPGAGGDPGGDCPGAVAPRPRAVKRAWRSWASAT